MRLDDVLTASADAVCEKLGDCVVYFSCRTLYYTLMAPRWTYAGGRYHPLPNFGTDKSGLSLGRSGEWALREGRWKYVNLNGYEYLYDIVADPQEKHRIWDHSTMKRLKDKMYNWWQSMLADGGSFSPPAFYIGYPGSRSSMIFAAGVAKASGGWAIKTHAVNGDIGPGQFLQYKVIVAGSGGYNVKVRFQ